MGLSHWVTGLELKKYSPLLLLTQPAYLLLTYWQQTMSLTAFVLTRAKMPHTELLYVIGNGIIMLIQLLSMILCNFKSPQMSLTQLKSGESWMSLFQSDFAILTALHAQVMDIRVFVLLAIISMSLSKKVGKLVISHAQQVMEMIAMILWSVLLVNPFANTVFNGLNFV